MMDRNKEIKSFVSNFIDKNYAAASNHLTSVVEGKIKQKIAKATKKDLF